MESEVLAYSALESQVNSIVQDIAKAVPVTDSTAPIIIVGTTADVNNFTQWYVKMAQMELLQSWASKIEPPKAAGPGNRLQDIALVTSVVGLISGIAQSFAVKESATSVKGTIADAPFIHALGGALQKARYQVFVPSEYLPSLLYKPEFSNSPLFKKLSDLDTARKNLRDQMAAHADEIANATAIAKNPKSTKPQVEQSQPWIDYASDATTVIGEIDAFKSSLFSSKPSASTAAPTDGTKSPAGSAAAGSTGTTTTTTVTTTVTTKAAPPGSSPASNGDNTAKTQSASNQASAGSSVEGVLAADLLLRAIEGQVADENAVDARLKNTYLLIPHTLESGGTTMARGSMFSGQHLYSSGGSVTTFVLFALDSRGVICAENRWAYSGMYKDDDLPDAIKKEKFEVVSPAHWIPCR